MTEQKTNIETLCAIAHDALTDSFEKHDYIITQCNDDINAAIKDLANEKEIRNAILRQLARGSISQHISVKFDRQTNNTRIAALRHFIADKKRERDASVQKWRNLIEVRNAVNTIQNRTKHDVSK